jgi:hypothetical protein
MRCTRPIIFTFVNLRLKEADCFLALYMKELVQVRRWESLYAPYGTPEEMSALHSEMDKTQKWIHSAEYQTASAREIDAQHTHLKSLARMVRCYQEAKNRPIAVGQLKEYAEQMAYKTRYHSNVLKDENEFVQAQCEETIQWLEYLLADQERLPKNAEPCLTAQMVLQRKRELEDLVSFVLK